jgi:hypothetical protein
MGREWQSNSIIKQKNGIANERQLSLIRCTKQTFEPHYHELIKMLNINK